MTAQHPDDILAMRMMETARLERKRAAERDGVHPGGLVACKRPGAKSYRGFSKAGVKARALIAQNPSLTAKELAALSGIGERRARHVMLTSGIDPAQRNGAPRSKAGIEAERMAREGRNASEIVALLGVSRQMARRAVQRAQKEAAA